MEEDMQWYLRKSISNMKITVATEKVPGKSALSLWRVLVVACVTVILSCHPEHEIEDKQSENFIKGRKIYYHFENIEVEL